MKKSSPVSSTLKAYAVVLVSVGALSLEMAAGDDKPIGRITQIDKGSWSVRLAGTAGERVATLSAPIFEHDIVQTITKQSITLLFEDGTEITVGPSSRVVVRNWTARDATGRLVRSIYLHFGLLKAKVRKVYSQGEPFIIENKNAVAAVRGTEFVVEAGIRERLERRRELPVSEQLARKGEVELHTLEGEVHFAKSLADLAHPEMHVSVQAGQTSLVRESLTRPQASHAFDLPAFKSYVAKIVPHLGVSIARNTTNEQRAELAVNAKLKSNGLSPVKNYGQSERASRGIASLPASGTILPTNVFKKPHAKMTEPRQPVTIDGAHQAFQGREQLNGPRAEGNVPGSRPLTPDVSAKLATGDLLGKPSSAVSGAALTNPASSSTLRTKSGSFYVPKGLDTSKFGDRIRSTQ